MSNYTVVSNGDFATLTALLEGELYTADNNHPNFSEILVGLSSNRDEADVIGLFDVGVAIKGKFDILGERVTVRGNDLFFDGDVIAGPVVDQILHFHKEGEEFGPLVSFLEAVQNNPQEESRDSLYRWLTATGGFTITPYGTIIGYKGVRGSESEDIFYSISSGYAVVDGEEVNGQVPQKVGSVVTMPRSKVAFDPAQACSTGLHVGTWEYANSFAQGAVLTVEVDPRDVVSVPTDCGGQKMRVCRYTVLDVVDAPHASGLYSGYDDQYDVDDQGYDSSEAKFAVGDRVRDEEGDLGTVEDIYSDNDDGYYEYKVRYDDTPDGCTWLGEDELDKVT